jgi:nucleoid DNA-binding protein
MEAQQFDAMCEQYMALVTRREALREELKDASQRVKLLEDQIQRHMEDNDITELPFPNFTIKMRERQSKRTPKRDEMAEILAGQLNVEKTEIVTAIDGMRSLQTKRCLKATRTA